MQPHKTDGSPSPDLGAASALELTAVITAARRLCLVSGGRVSLVIDAGGVSARLDDGRDCPLASASAPDQYGDAGTEVATTLERLLAPAGPLMGGAT